MSDDTKQALDHWSEIQGIDIDEQNLGEDYTPEESQKADERGKIISEGLGEIMRAGFDPSALK